MGFSICKLCNTEHHVQSGAFSRHLKKEHNLSYKEYLIKTKYNGVSPKCQCGFCNKEPEFYRGSFKTHATGHKNHQYLKKQHIKNYGIPTCPTCSSDIERWHRGKPAKYCSHTCIPSQWNQEKIKETVKKKYGVDNVFQADEVKKKIEEKVDRVENSKKARKTKKNKYKNGNHDPEKMRRAVRKKYGVDHISQLRKNRIASSKRMIKYNSNPKNHYLSKKYKNTNLYYQSSYELEFLELCEDLGIIHKVKNGNSYNYLEENQDFGTRLLTDFSIDDYEIEIKSTYIMKKQGGMLVLNAKRRAVEKEGKTYILILDKDYSEFLDINK